MSDTFNTFGPAAFYSPCLIYAGSLGGLTSITTNTPTAGQLVIITNIDVVWAGGAGVGYLEVGVLGGTTFWTSFSDIDTVLSNDQWRGWQPLPEEGVAVVANNNTDNEARVTITGYVYSGVSVNLS